MTPAYRGLTWDHPRGLDALAAAAREMAPAQGLALSWDTQPLEGFESAPIAELCARYDLVVLDHPHVGDAVAADCLLPLEDVLEPTLLDDIAATAIGASYASYHYAGHQWALPLDAATQVMACRPDRVDPPATWDAVETLAAEGGVALSLAGPHAVLSFLSIAAALGQPTATLEPQVLVGDEIGHRAYELMARIHASAEPAVAALNPIGLLAHMATHDDVRLCPLVYGYVNYTRPAAGAHALAFADAPRFGPGGTPGSTLGGTGIAVSRRCDVTPELRAHLAWLMQADTQRRFIPAHDGQPSRREAWQDASVNADWPNFYQATAATLEAASVRPRYAGYIAWQTAASAWLRESLDTGRPPAETIAWLNTTHREAIGDQHK